MSMEEMEPLVRGWVAQHPEGSREHRHAVWQLIRLLSHTGRQSEGLQLLETLLAATSDPESRSEIILATGGLMEGLEDYESAASAYSRGVGLEPVGQRTWYFLHNNLGYCLLRLERFSEAELWCREAIRIDPRRHNAYKNLGLACLAQGRITESARNFIAAVQADAADPRALTALEKVVDAHPELADEIPGLDGQVVACRAAVDIAREARMAAWKAALGEARAKPPE